MKKALIMAGGTGGHVMPALSIARRLQSQGFEILWLGARGRMEEILVPKAGFNIAYIQVHGLRRNGLKTMLGAPLMICRAIRQARAVIKKFQPDVVIGMGGYASGPGGLAAKLLHIPLIVHEQNAAAGMTNRLLFHLADRMLLGFPGAFSGPKCVVTGNPVRPEIAALHDQARTFLQDQTLHVLVVGGSLGAQALNEKLPALLQEFCAQVVTPAGFKLSVRHQCGRGNSAAVQERYAGASFACQAADFIDDMAAAYLEADVVICRAGALTAAEVAAAGMPAVYIPLPTAVDDHQTKNAASQVAGGGAELIAQRDLTAETLIAALQPCLERGELQRRSACQKKAARLDAAGLVLAEIEKLICSGD